MRIVKLSLAATLTCAAIGSQAPAMAATPGVRTAEPAATVAARERATDRLLLEAVLKRRADLLRKSGDTDARRAALAFLDQRLVELKQRTIR